MSRKSQFDHLKPAIQALFQQGQTFVQVAKQYPQIGKATLQRWQTTTPIKVSNVVKIRRDVDFEPPTESIAQSRIEESAKNRVEESDIEWAKKETRSLFNVAEMDKDRIAAMNCFVNILKLEVSAPSLSRKEEVKEDVADYSNLDTTQLAILYREKLQSK